MRARPPGARRRRLRAPPADAPAGPAGARRSTSRFLGLDDGEPRSVLRASSAPRRPVRPASCAARPRSRCCSRGLPGCVRGCRPDSSTRISSTPTSTGARAAAGAGRSLVSTKHNDDPVPAPGRSGTSSASSRAAPRRVICITDGARALQRRRRSACRGEARGRPLRAGRAPRPPGGRRRAAAPDGRPRAARASHGSSAQKGLDVAIEALAELRRGRARRPRSSCSAREPRARSARGSCPRACGVGEAVHFAGPVGDVAAWLRRAELSSSIRRGGRASGSCCSRRCCAELPIVATRRELDPGDRRRRRDGTLVPPDDAGRARGGPRRAPRRSGAVRAAYGRGGPRAGAQRVLRRADGRPDDRGLRGTALGWLPGRRAGRTASRPTSPSDVERSRRARAGSRRARPAWRVELARAPRSRPRAASASSVGKRSGGSRSSTSASKRRVRDEHRAGTTAHASKTTLSGAPERMLLTSASAAGEDAPGHRCAGSGHRGRRRPRGRARRRGARAPRGLRSSRGRRSTCPWQPEPHVEPRQPGEADSAHDRRRAPSQPE